VELLPSYKAHRVADAGGSGISEMSHSAATQIEESPDQLAVQVPLIIETLTALGLRIVGKDGYEADDVVGTLARTAGIPVDVVTGDRDLFQVIDDARDVRVLSTIRGMRNLEVVTDGVLHGKYGIRAAQYADYAALRGDPSDGLPGVPGIGEKTAANLITEFGDLPGVLAAAADETVPLSAAVRGRLRGAAEYLERARRVVTVVRDLPLPPVEATIVAPEPGALDGLRERWGLGGSLDRAAAAIGDAAPTASA
jgi:5'-3' exonuclease